LTLDRADEQIRVLLLENIHPGAAARLSKDGYQVETVARALDEDELIGAIGGVQLLGIRSGTHVTERVLDAAPGLLAVGAFCIDRYEYTAPGDDLPLNYASFQKATSVCEGLGKRVCTESEWNFACEGEEMRPYPYGFSREATCNQDRTDLYEPNPHYQILADRREPAAARPGCVSPFGVYNMAGNMDEPVLREGSAHVEPYRNALKGGWWMAARNRCRPATTAHDDYYKDIQVGVRCCSGAT